MRCRAGVGPVSVRAPAATVVAGSRGTLPALRHAPRFVGRLLRKVSKEHAEHHALGAGSAIG